MAHEQAEKQYTDCGKALKEHNYPEERKEQDRVKKLEEYRRGKLKQDVSNLSDH